MPCMSIGAIPYKYAAAAHILDIWIQRWRHDNVSNDFYKEHQLWHEIKLFLSIPEGDCEGYIGSNQVHLYPLN